MPMTWMHKQELNYRHILAGERDAAEPAKAGKERDATAVQRGVRLIVLSWG